MSDKAYNNDLRGDDHNEKHSLLIYISTTRQWKVSYRYHQRVPQELKVHTQKYFLAFTPTILLHLAHRRPLAQARATSVATRAASLSPRWS